MEPTDLDALKSDIDALLRKAADVAVSTSPVLVVGENGTGKEALARWIHDRSPRASGPFVVVRCEPAASLVAAAERARHGTLFLDDVDSLTAEAQSILASLSWSAMDVRVIGAVDHELVDDLVAGRFREDLYRRLAFVQLRMPPLRAIVAGSGLQELWLGFVRRAAELEGLDPPPTAPAVFAALRGYPWPGNFDELESVAKRAVVLSHGTPIEPGHLPASVVDDEGVLSVFDHLVPGASMAEIERAAILRTLAAAGGSTVRCAEILGISVRKVQYRLKQWREEAAGVSGW